MITKSPHDRPQQFRVIDLFAVLTLAALLFAAAAPFVRELNEVEQRRLLMIATCQLAITTGTVVFLVFRRGKVLQDAGPRLGVGYYAGAVRWQHWPLFKSVMSMLILAALQLVLALLYVFQFSKSYNSLSLALYHLQLAIVLGIGFVRYWWRLYPGAVEFFESGISLRCTDLIAWELVELRQSQYAADRIVLVVRQTSESRAGVTMTVQVPQSVCDELLKRWSG